MFQQKSPKEPNNNSVIPRVYRREATVDRRDLAFKFAMKIKKPRSTKHDHRSPNSEYQIQTLDREVLQPAWEWAPDPSGTLQRVMPGEKSWTLLEENDFDWDWDGIERRGSRKPSLDDYDRWPLQPGSLAGDKTGRNHFSQGWQTYERWLSERNGLS